MFPGRIFARKSQNDRKFPVTRERQAKTGSPMTARTATDLRKPISEQGLREQPPIAGLKSAHSDPAARAMASNRPEPADRRDALLSGRGEFDSVSRRQAERKFAAQETSAHPSDSILRHATRGCERGFDAHTVPRARDIFVTASWDRATKPSMSRLTPHKVPSFFMLHRTNAAAVSSWGGS